MAMAPCSTNFVPRFQRRGLYPRLRHHMTGASASNRAGSAAGLSTLRSGILGFLTLLLFAAPASAQLITGQILEEGTNQPVRGALVTLLTADSIRITGLISNTQGQYLFRLDEPGVYLIRVDRIGAETSISPSIEVRGSNTVRFDISSRPVMIEIEGLRAEGTGRCEVRPEEGVPANRLWSQARTALELTRLTTAEGLLEYELVRYERLYLLDQMQRLSLKGEQVGSLRSPRAFESRPVDRLMDEGFVSSNGVLTSFHMPDPNVLLSDGFLDTHCFRAVFPEDDQSVVGIRFEPLDTERRPDISGVLWLGAERADLQTLEYEYVGGGLDALVEDSPMATPGRAPGGQASFLRLPDGRWVVTNWWIRMPEVGRARVRSGRVGTVGTIRIEGGRGQAGIVGFRQVGGQVRHVVELNENRRVWSSITSSTVTGSITDGLWGGALRGGTVRVLGSTETAEVGESGAFVLSGVAPGPTVLVVDRDRDRELGLDPAEISVSLLPGSNEVGLTLPGPESVFESHCSDTPDDDQGLLSVFVTNQNGNPAVGAIVRVEYPSRRGRNAATREYVVPDFPGILRLCDVWTDSEFELVAEFDGSETEPQRFRFAEGERVAAMRFRVSVSR